MKYGVPQVSVLGLHLFLIYINDLHNAIKFSTVHHFADDTNLLVSNSCIKKIQDQINLDLKYLCKWLKANKISLNTSKTKVLIFRHQNKLIITIIPYLGILIDSFLNWNFHIDELSTKLSRAVGMLTKIRHYVNEKTLSMVYHGIFSSLLLSGSQIWGQSNQSVSKMEKLESKALRIFNFKPFRYSVTSIQ